MLQQAVRLEAAGAVLAADVAVPPVPHAVVVFAHGSGSSRLSPRNRQVAGQLQTAGFATILADLLTPDEEQVDAQTARLRFDIGMLAGRVVGVIDWATGQPDLARLPVGLFGASTGAAAALVAATRRPVVSSVVSRGGRPDLAGAALPLVLAPTLLIVGEQDGDVVRLNEEASRRLGGPHQLRVVPGATHLFPEPGALELVAQWATEWFTEHLSTTTGHADDDADE
jgi:putative phosphoribosyl transferase